MFRMYSEKEFIDISYGIYLEIVSNNNYDTLINYFFRLKEPESLFPFLKKERTFLNVRISEIVYFEFPFDLMETVSLLYYYNKNENEKYRLTISFLDPYRFTILLKQKFSDSIREFKKFIYREDKKINNMYSDLSKYYNLFKRSEEDLTKDDFLKGFIHICNSLQMNPDHYLFQYIEDKMDHLFGLNNWFWEEDFNVFVPYVIRNF